ncbi:MAG: hypothetical protein IS632_09295 [Thaumarchaeota archaeon]|nr:hypothetical protein [Nitrososphaerota archaeon]
MDVEKYIVDNVLATMDIGDEYKKDIRDVYDRVRRLFITASVNRNLDNFFLTRDAVNYCRAFHIPNTALIHGAKADYQTHNLWADVYNKTIKKAGLTDEEKSLLHCLRYMLAVESRYSQIVDKVCYLLVWQTNPPGMILGENGYRCKKVDSVDTISTRCSLATKLEFLTNGGFGDLAGACDTDLRNAAAHMTTIIGKPTVKNERYNTGTTAGFKTNFSIEGSDIHIKRRSKTGADSWEKLDIDKTGHRLDMTVWRYSIVFSLCNSVHTFTTTLRPALSNQDDLHRKFTFSKGKIRLSLNASDKSLSGQTGP